MINKIPFLYIFIISILQSCSQHRPCPYLINSIFENCNTQNKNNILTILPLNYSYKGMSLFSFKQPKADSYSILRETNYLMTDDSLVYLASITKGCESEYQKANYAVYKLYDDSDNTKAKSFCDIVITPLCNFNQKIKDTFRFNGEYSWVTLENKFYSNSIKDTLYSYAIRNYAEYEIMLVASKKNGIVGLTRRYFSESTNKYFISERLGHIFPNDSIPPNYTIENSTPFITHSTSSVNLDLIKEFDKCTSTDK